MKESDSKIDINKLSEYMRERSSDLGLNWNNLESAIAANMVQEFFIDKKILKYKNGRIVKDEADT